MNKMNKYRRGGVKHELENVIRCSDIIIVLQKSNKNYKGNTKFKKTKGHNLD